MSYSKAFLAYFGCSGGNQKQKHFHTLVWAIGFLVTCEPTLATGSCGKCSYTHRWVNWDTFFCE